jgi:hypothetical protein
MGTDRIEIMGTWIIGEVFLLNVYRTVLNDLRMFGSF